MIGNVFFLRLLNGAGSFRAVLLGAGSDFSRVDFAVRDKIMPIAERRQRLVKVNKR